MRRIFALLLCVVIVGCFPATKEELKRDGQVDRFDVADNYQVVYRRLAPLMRECMESSWIGDRVVVRADLYTDLRRAELVLEGINALPPTRRVMLMFELEAVGDNSTNVTFTNGFPRREPLPQKFVQWARGELKTCD